MNMKKSIFSLLCIFIMFTVHAQSSNPKYDKPLADSLGADDYGMKMYVLVILKTGSNVSETKTVTDSLFNGHMQNIGRLVESGKLIVSGPIKKNDKNYRGIFILNAKAIEEAREMLATDPAINAKLLDTEMFQWYGSAALPLYLKSHDKLQKKSF